ncbi:NADPH-dependent FMN reductase [Niabella drilacis]|uniref:NAD(P)H-dependent FMN reductase n=1 Tax=Niabella drilacis (strain DSM 25811 / CCM 8410 / CCUG 62505 / LMG 26954 / E90) TaxID=1285928 RepID=A0A1G6JVX3_NIADE|nr:NADPH-dependent FMN reductase [Niabella drilacis]SDC22808.1 NAD(P)H-dependent FMN reductase [Niabella drilacis]
MEQRKNILVIIGSASAGSSSEKLALDFARQTEAVFTITMYQVLKTLPHFDPDLSVADPPEAVMALRKEIAQADGILICTPEYVFSIPSGLKNAIEWCVATTVFSEKPVGLITASASGVKGHAELKMILQTVGASFTEDTTLLIQGVKGKISGEGQITDSATEKAFGQFVKAFIKFVEAQ